MEKITLKKKTDSKIYNFLRQYYIKDMIGNIGTIIEDDDKFICQVEQKKLERNKKEEKTEFYELTLKGRMIPIGESTDELMKKFHIEKPVEYIFDGIVFNSNLKFSAMNCTVIFKNCTFNCGLRIKFADKVILENNKYIDNTGIYNYGNSFLYGRSINELVIKNDNFLNSYESQKYDNNKFGINICTNKLTIINSNILVENDGQININSKDTTIEKTNIMGNEIYLDSKHLTTPDSMFISKNGIIIENKECDFSGKVKSPVIIYNGIEINTNNETFHIDNELCNLRVSRQQLLEQLQRLKKHCNETNFNQMQELKKELDSKPISKVLKKN